MEMFPRGVREAQRNAPNHLCQTRKPANCSRLLYQNKRAQTIGGQTMTVAPRSSSPQQAFQFRIATLLTAMVWAGLMSLSLRTPTPLWSGLIAVLTLLAALVAILVAIYRTGRTRAMAIGFLVFSGGFLIHLAILAGTLSSGLSSDTTPTGHVFAALFAYIHPARQVSIGGFSGMAGIPGGSGGVATAMVLPFDKDDFVSICNHGFACLLGIAGAVVAQVLFATHRPNETANDR
jgi:hypothetical protein